MTIINKITTLRIPNSLSEEDIQTHIDAQNVDGWYLICLDGISGWYRFFWEKLV